MAVAPDHIELGCIVSRDKPTLFVPDDDQMMVISF